MNSAQKIVTDAEREINAHIMTSVIRLMIITLALYAVNYPY